MKRSHLTLSAAVIGFYLLLAIIITYPLVAQIGTHFAGFVYGDAYEQARHVWWIGYALQNGMSPFYQSLLGYPNGFAAIGAWASPLQFFPAWLLALFLPLPAALNATLLLSLALNGWTMWLLVRWLTGSGWAALLAGAVYMLYPTMQGHIGAGHAGLLVQWGAPLYVYALLRLRTYGGIAAILFAAGMLLLTVGGHPLQPLYVVLPITAVIALWLLYRREGRALRRVIAAALIGVALHGLYLLPVISALAGTSAYADAGGTVRYSADLLSIVTPSFFHPLFGQLDYTRAVLGVNLDEGAAYLGMITAGLIIVALITRRESRPFVWLALLAYALALGPLLKVFDQPVAFMIDGYASFITLPSAALVDVPLLNLARTPARFNFVLALAAAIMAGYGAAVVMKRLTPSITRLGFALIGIALIAFEYQTFFPLPTAPADLPPAIMQISGRDDMRAVFNAPADNLLAAKEALYLQTAHNQPLIAGQDTRATPVSPAKLALLATFDVALLDHAGADVVIIHRAYDDGLLEARAREQLGDPFYIDVRFALFDVPISDAAPAFATISPPDGAITTTRDLYAYAPALGWLNFRATLNGGDARMVTLLLDGAPVHQWAISDTINIDLALPAAAAASHTITLALDPPCPAHFHPSLVCRAVDLTDAEITFTESAPSDPDNVTWRRGVTLERGMLTHTEDALHVNLAWRFAESRTMNDIRYVHVLNAENAPVAQLDAPIGDFDANTRWIERMSIDLPADLPAGDYRVVVGWYEYPSITNFCLDASDDCDPVAQIGVFTVD